MSQEDNLIDKEHDVRGWNENYSRLYDYGRESYANDDDGDDIEQYDYKNKQEGWNTSFTSCCSHAYSDDDEEFGRCYNCKEMSTILYIKE
jgi:hypothetical protein